MTPGHRYWWCEREGRERKIDANPGRPFSNAPHNSHSFFLSQLISITHSLVHGWLLRFAFHLLFAFSKSYCVTYSSESHFNYKNSHLFVIHYRSAARHLYFGSYYLNFFLLWKRVRKACKHEVGGKSNEDKWRKWPNWGFLCFFHHHLSIFSAKYWQIMDKKTGLCARGQYEECGLWAGDLMEWEREREG